MRKIKILSAIGIGLVIAVMAMVFSPSSPAPQRGSSWTQPIDLALDKLPFASFGRLQKTGDATYFRISVSAPTTVPVRVDIPSRTNEKFAPQLVVFEPHSSTIGPLLPLIQPPQTIALVYPLTPTKQMFDPITQVSFTVRLEAQPELDAKGTYLMAVYNAGSAGGAYRLMVGDNPAAAGWPDAWMLPIYWWRDQTFAGFNWMTLIFPAVLGLLVWFIYLRLDHHRLHVHKNYPPPAVKKSKS